jgi:hypothetical protein
MTSGERSWPWKQKASPRRPEVFARKLEHGGTCLQLSMFVAISAIAHAGALPTRMRFEMCNSMLLAKHKGLVTKPMRMLLGAIHSKKGSTFLTW